MSRLSKRKKVSDNLQERKNTNKTEEILKAAMSKYEEENYDDMQLQEIRLGVEHNVNVSHYANENFLFLQMREIRIGLEAGVDVSVYAKEVYDWFQMAEIRQGLQQKLEVSIYANPDLHYLVMRVIRKGLKDGINLLPYVEKGYQTPILQQIRKAYLCKASIDSYVEQGYDANQLEQIRKGLVNHVDVKVYADKILVGSQMQEIRLGLESEVDVSQYSSRDFNWMQMREIRLGLEKKLSIFWYLDKNFSSRQMREIRLGLEENINVANYAMHIWSATDMYQNRMLQKLYGIGSGENAEELEKEASDMEHLAIVGKERILVRVSDDEMIVELMLLPPENEDYTLEDIMEALKSEGVKQGINQDEIVKMLEEKIYNQNLIVAEGKKCKDGTDGYYTYFFKQELPVMPKILEDDSVDYQNVEFFEKVWKNQKLVEYVKGTRGEYGYNVKGKLIMPKNGKDLPKLKGSGFSLLEDEVTYVARMDGRVESGEGTLYTYKGDVTTSVGNIRFNGDIHITGYVGTGVIIEAEGDIIIDGNVEAAIIRAGKNVLVRSGVCAANRGIIEAGHNIYGKYFEKVRLIAGNDIESNYMLNCDSVANGMVTVTGKKGAIVGGGTSAILGVRAYVIGNQAELKTQFEVGENSYYLAKIKAWDHKLEKTENEMTILKNEMNKFLRTRSLEQLKGLSVYQNIQLALLVKKKEIVAIEQEKEEFVAIKNKKIISVEVLGMTHPGCIIKVDNVSTVVKRKVPRVSFRKKGTVVAMYDNFGR